MPEVDPSMGSLGNSCDIRCRVSGAEVGVAAVGSCGKKDGRRGLVFSIYEGSCLGLLGLAGLGMDVAGFGERRFGAG